MHFQLPVYFDYLATLIWAVSGALLAARRGFAIMGILTVAMISSTGGGLLRDGLFLQNGPPVLLRSPTYLGIIALGVILVVLFGRWLDRLPHGAQLVSTVDALGLGAYASVGMCHALEAGLSLLGVVVVGMVNAVGGGILRDVLLRQPVGMFLPGTLEQAAALVGCGLFLLLLKGFGLSEVAAAWVTIVFVFTLRVLAIRYRIQSRPLAGLSPDQDA